MLKRIEIIYAAENDIQKTEGNDEDQHAPVYYHSPHATDHNQDAEPVQQFVEDSLFRRNQREDKKHDRQGQQQKAEAALYKRVLQLIQCALQSLHPIRFPTPAERSVDRHQIGTNQSPTRRQFVLLR